MNPDVPAIDIQDLMRGYGRAKAVDGLTLQVRPGRCYGFLERNGAGKTTTIKCLLEYAASFREHWNRDIETDLLRRFELDELKRTGVLSKGMKSQLALICAICPEPDLLLLDETTSGLDPVVRREFIETVIGSYQEGDPEKRTVFVLTHLIAEFEGLIDEFTIIDEGKNRFTLET